MHRALAVRSPIQFHETAGAVYDSLAQIHLIQGDYDASRECLERARDSYGVYGKQTSHWVDWSVRVLLARLALRSGAVDDAVAQADAMIDAGAPAFDSLQATLIAAEALAAGGHLDAAEGRLKTAADQLDSADGPGRVGRVPADSRHAARTAQPRVRGVPRLFSERDTSRSARRTLPLRSQPARHRPGRGPRRSPHDCAAPSRRGGGGVPEAACDARHLDTEAARRLLSGHGSGEDIIAQPDADDALVRRIVESAELPELLDCETTTTLLEASGGTIAVLYLNTLSGVKVVTALGCSEEQALEHARAALDGVYDRTPSAFVESLGRHADGPRGILVMAAFTLGYPTERRLRMLAAVARQGFSLCAARERSAVAPGPSADRSLEPVLPGFLCASAVMNRVVDQIQRLQGNDLTVLITGESGTGKELVARAIHVGSHRSNALFLPYNCTTTGRDLADSQLFGHRRGAFTGAVSDQPGLIRLAVGGTLFLDEIGDLPLDVQPKLLRFLEQSEIMPVGDSRPIKVDVRVIAATNADLEQRVNEGRFREDSRLPARRDPHHVTATSRAPRRDSASRHAVPSRSGGTPQQTGRHARNRCARHVLPVPVARERSPAEERDPADRGDERSGTRDRYLASFARDCGNARRRCRHRSADSRGRTSSASGSDTRWRRRRGRARGHSGCADDSGREHLRSRARPRPDPARALPEAPPPRAGEPRGQRIRRCLNGRVDYKVSSHWLVRIPSIHTIASMPAHLRLKSFDLTHGSTVLYMIWILSIPAGLEAGRGT
ncbi:MAG: sigma 54-interacting transcriptional regulator [Vicinamibacterales bacterium]